MSQILIIDIQKDYEKFIGATLANDIKDYCSSFSSIVYLWDNINTDDLYSQVVDEYLEDEEFYDSLTIISKQYGFIRGFMDLGLEEDELVKLGKFLIKNNITDGRYIYEDEELLSKYEEEFKNDECFQYSFEGYNFYLPSDLIEDIQSHIREGVVLVGGYRSQCLREVSILLKILDINHTINESLTY